MDVEEKNFSGHKWTDSGRDSGNGKARGCCRMQRKESWGKGERNDGKSTKVGRNCYGSGFTRSRWTGCQAKREEGDWRHVAFLRKGEKRYLVVCDSNNESNPSRSPTQNRMFYRVNVNAIPVRVLRVTARSLIDPLQLHLWYRNCIDLCRVISSPTISTRKESCVTREIGTILSKIETVQVRYDNICLIHVIIHRKISSSSVMGCE